jgi:hypothetical protein
MQHRTVQLVAIALIVNFSIALKCVAEEISAADIISKCRIRTDAADLRGRLDFSIKNSSGKIVKNRQAIYFWKDYAGSDALLSKTILFVSSPPSDKDTAYLRYEYTVDSGREPEQWLYVPHLQRVLRLAMRDTRDQAWGVVGDDLKVLQWGDGTQQLIRTEKDMRGTIYWIEITPKSTKLPYAKLKSAFLRAGDSWDRCARWRTEFLDKENNLIKVLTEDWTQQQQIWYRQRVQVENKEARTITEYGFRDVEFNSGLTDGDFTTRQLQHADRMTPSK